MASPGPRRLFSRLVETYFDSPEALVESAASEEWRAMHADGQRLVERYGMSLQAGAAGER